MPLVCVLEYVCFCRNNATLWWNGTTNLCKYWFTIKKDAATVKTLHSSSLCVESEETFFTETACVICWSFAQGWCMEQINFLFKPDRLLRLVFVKKESDKIMLCGRGELTEIPCFLASTAFGEKMFLTVANFDRAARSAHVYSMSVLM